jgi:hypothetical protein
LPLILAIVLPVGVLAGFVGYHYLRPATPAPVNGPTGAPVGPSPSNPANVLNQAQASANQALAFATGALGTASNLADDASNLFS